MRKQNIFNTLLKATISWLPVQCSFGFFIRMLRTGQLLNFVVPGEVKNLTQKTVTATSLLLWVPFS